MRPSDAGYQPIHARTGDTPPLVIPRAEDTAGEPAEIPPQRGSGELFGGPLANPLLADPLLAPWREQLAGLDDPWPAGPSEVPDDPLDLPPPPPPAVVARLLSGPDALPREAWPRDDDTMPLALGPARRHLDRDADRDAEQNPEQNPLETPPRGLRKFDLGSVPASVTPPRTWRKAAWFAVGTSAAVACGLVIAAIQLVGTPWSGSTIDALPAYPTTPLEIERLPIQETSTPPATSRQARKDPSTNPGRGAGTPPVSATGPAGDVEAAGSSTVPQTLAPSSTAPEAALPPSVLAGNTPPLRTTVGPLPVTPTAPEKMGDRTEEYFALVAVDPVAAYALCTGDLAEEGPEGIAARYHGVERVEVQEIVIDRNHAVTTSTLRLVHGDGTSTVEKRRLIFTWGGDPKIIDDKLLS